MPGTQQGQEGIKGPWTRVTGDCEPRYDAVNWSLVLSSAQLISLISSPFVVFLRQGLTIAKTALELIMWTRLTSILLTPVLPHSPTAWIMGVSFHNQLIKYFLKSRTIAYEVRTRRVKTYNIPLVLCESLIHAIFCRVVNQDLWCTMELVLYSCNERAPSWNAGTDFQEKGYRAERMD